LLFLIVVLVCASVFLALYGQKLMGPKSQRPDSFERSYLGHHAFYTFLEKLSYRRQRIRRLSLVKKASAPMFFIEPAEMIVHRGKQVFLREVLKKRREAGYDSIVVLPKWELTKGPFSSFVSLLPKSKTLPILLAAIPSSGKIPELVFLDEKVLSKKKKKHHPMSVSIFDKDEKKTKEPKILTGKHKLPAAKNYSFIFHASEESSMRALQSKKPMKTLLQKPMGFRFVKNLKASKKKQILKILKSKLSSSSDKTKGKKQEHPILKRKEREQLGTIGDVVLGAKGGSLILRYQPRDQGVTWVVSEPDLLHNFNLHRAEHGAIWLALLRKELKSKTILVDEVFHGHSKKYALADKLSSFPNVLFVIHGLLLLLVFAWAGAHRFGVPIMGRGERERGPREVLFITTWVLAHGKRPQKLVVSYIQYCLRDAMERLRLESSGTLEERVQRLDQAAERLGIDAEGEKLLQMSQEIDTNAKMTFSSSLKWAQKAWSYRRHLLLKDKRISHS